jgi:hypothetical protein
MKNNQILVLGLLFLATTFNLNAQDGNIPLNEPNYNKPRLFNLLPARIEMSTAKLQELIGTPNGQTAQIPVAADQATEIAGEVIGAVSKYNNTIQSVVIRCSDFDGARLTLSKVNMPDGTTKFTGRIISIRHGDLYQLEQENGTWALVKKNFYDLVNE